MVTAKRTNREVESTIETEYLKLNPRIFLKVAGKERLLNLSDRVNRIKCLTDPGKYPTLFTDETALSREISGKCLEYLVKGRFNVLDSHHLQIFTRDLGVSFAAHPYVTDRSQAGDPLNGLTEYHPCNISRVHQGSIDIP